MVGMRFEPGIKARFGLVLLRRADLRMAGGGVPEGQLVLAAVLPSGEVCSVPFCLGSVHGFFLHFLESGRPAGGGRTW